jgi:hypothetical protein
MKTIVSIICVILIILVPQTNQYNNCDLDPNAIGNAKGGSGCICAPGFIFKTTGSNNVWCERDCQNIPNSNGLANPNNFAECLCNNGFIWSSVDLVCGRDCTNDPYSKKTYNVNNINQC